VKTAHTTVGFVFVAVFLATGVYMRLNFPELHRNDGVMRLLFRSAHIYILFAALLNLVAGAHLRCRMQAWRYRVQVIGSILLLVSPAIFTIAFFAEPAPQHFARPFVLSGVIIALAGTVLHVVSAFGDQTSNAQR